MGYSKICFRIVREGGGGRGGEPAMVLVWFEYLRSDSERKLLIGQFNLTMSNKKAQTCLKTVLGCRRVAEEFYLLKNGSQDICKDTESNLGPFADFQGWNYPEASFISVSVLNNSRRIIMSSSQLCSLLCFFFRSRSASPPRSLFRLNHVKKVRKRCSHSRFSFQAIILGFFDRNVGLCCSCFSVATGDRAFFRWVKQWREVKDQSSGKRGRTQIIQGSLQALSRARPLAIQKQILE